MEFKERNYFNEVIKRGIDEDFKTEHFIRAFRKSEKEYYSKNQFFFKLIKAIDIIEATLNRYYDNSSDSTNKEKFVKSITLEYQLNRNQIVFPKTHRKFTFNLINLLRFNIQLANSKLIMDSLLVNIKDSDIILLKSLHDIIVDLNNSNDIELDFSSQEIFSEVRVYIIDLVMADKKTNTSKNTKKESISIKEFKDAEWFKVAKVIVENDLFNMSIVDINNIEGSASKYFEGAGINKRSTYNAILRHTIRDREKLHNKNLKIDLDKVNKIIEYYNSIRFKTNSTFDILKECQTKLNRNE